jgi:hypothetical protein
MTKNTILLEWSLRLNASGALYGGLRLLALPTNVILGKKSLDSDKENKLDLNLWLCNELLQLKWRHNTRHNDTQHYATRALSITIKGLVEMLSVTPISIMICLVGHFLLLCWVSCR